MTMVAAVKKADARAKETGRTYFVVFDYDDYTERKTHMVATDEDLDTFHACCREDDIRYSTDDGYYD